MRIATAIVLTCCLAMSNATFKLLKSRTRPRQQIQPIEGALNYLTTPVVIPVPLPTTYARPVSTLSKQVAAYTVSQPSAVAQAPTIPTYVATPAYSVPVYPQTLAVSYSAPPTVDYEEPYTAYIGSPSSTLFCL